MLTKQLPAWSECSSRMLCALARLAVVNNSMRKMNVKPTLHETVFISAYGQETVYFSNSRSYFTKSKDALGKREPTLSGFQTTTRNTLFWRSPLPSKNLQWPNRAVKQYQKRSLKRTSLADLALHSKQYFCYSWLDWSVVKRKARGFVLQLPS